jgi:hypothetical protein
MTYRRKTMRKNKNGKKQSYRRRKQSRKIMNGGGPNKMVVDDKILTHKEGIKYHLDGELMFLVDKEFLQVTNELLSEKSIKSRLSIPENRVFKKSTYAMGL